MFLCKYFTLLNGVETALEICNVQEKQDLSIMKFIEGWQTIFINVCHWLHGSCHLLLPQSKYMSILFLEPAEEGGIIISTYRGKKSVTSDNHFTTALVIILMSI